MLLHNYVHLEIFCQIKLFILITYYHSIHHMFNRIITVDLAAMSHKRFQNIMHRTNTSQWLQFAFITLLLSLCWMLWYTQNYMLELSMAQAFMQLTRSLTVNQNIVITVRFLWKCLAIHSYIVFWFDDVIDVAIST